MSATDPNDPTPPLLGICPLCGDDVRNDLLPPCDYGSMTCPVRRTAPGYATAQTLAAVPCRPARPPLPAMFDYSEKP